MTPLKPTISWALPPMSAISRCAQICLSCSTSTVRLLTNNPKKVEILTEAGINIVERVPLIVGRNPKNAHYLDTKAAKMGHLLSQ